MSTYHQDKISHGGVEIGALIDRRYEVVERIGEGGFATIFRARHIHIDRMVALKILKPRVLADPKRAEEFRSRFWREAQSAGHLRHPNVVTVHDFGFTAEEGLPYLVMEHLSGCDLKRALDREGAMSVERTLTLFEPCLEALALAHDQGIIHRDLKPSNLFLESMPGRPERLVILDFGIAGLELPFGLEDFDRTSNRLTGKGQILGTLEYMAPEYATAGMISPAMDVYQMGLVIAETLQGKPVVNGNTPWECIRQHLVKSYRLPEWIAKGPLGEVLSLALALEPSERYANANELLEALREARVNWQQQLGRISQECTATDPFVSETTGTTPTNEITTIPPEQMFLSQLRRDFDDDLPISFAKTPRVPHSQSNQIHNETPTFERMAMPFSSSEDTDTSPGLYTSKDTGATENGFGQRPQAQVLRHATLEQTRVEPIAAHLEQTRRECAVLIELLPRRDGVERFIERLEKAKTSEALRDLSASLRARVQPGAYRRLAPWDRCPRRGQPIPSDEALDPRTEMLLRQTDGTRTLESLIEGAPMARPRAALELLVLLQRGLIQI